MRGTSRMAALAAVITAVAIAIGATAGAWSSTQARKAGKEQQEYLLAIPGVRGSGGGAS